ncbi:MAG: hypothetical protein NVS1B10_03210 [Candidatus Saccharimonadales bacterium]
MKIIVLGDIHFPFHSKEALQKVLDVIKKERPSHVVQLGDLYDQYSFSTFSKRVYLNPQKELADGRALAVDMWRTTRSCGKPICIQIMGNHDVRIVKRITEKLPEAQEIFRKTMFEYYRFEGVTTIEDDRDIFEIGNVAFHHGYLSKLGDHMRTHGRNIVVGHSHTGGVIFEQRAGKTIFELNAGYLADETSEPLRYRPTKTSKWTLGYGIIDEKGPRFVSLE